MPLVLGLLLRRTPSRVYHASLSNESSPVLVSRVPTSMVLPPIVSPSKLMEQALSVMLMMTAAMIKMFLFIVCLF